MIRVSSLGRVKAMAKVDKTAEIQKKLENEIKKFRDANEQSKAAETNLTQQQMKLENEIKKFKDANEQCKAAETNLTQHLKDLNQEIQRLKDENTKYKSRCSNLEKAVVMLHERLYRLEGELQHSHDENRKLTESQKLLEEEDTAKKNELLNKDEQHKKEIQSLQAAIHIAENEKLDLERAFQQHQREFLFQQNEMKEKSKNIEHLQHEKQELIKTLKEMTGSRSLTVEVKCDLSDENRPTRLAEEYTALYNNEWKDMFATLSFSEEQRKTDYILKLLKHADQLSRMSSERHRSSIKRSFTTITVGDNPDLQKDTDDAVPGRRLNLTPNRRKSTADKSNSQADTVCYREILFDFEKLATTNKCTVNAVRAVVMSEVAADFEKAALDIISETLTGDLKKNESVKRFISKSVSFCWRMCRHDPPVHIKFQEITNRNVFDRDVYKPYKTSGQRVLFIVWPALFVHEGGPLLEKGIAEGRP